MEKNIEREKGINILSLDAGSLAGVLSQMHILAEIMDQLAAVQDMEGEILPSDHFDLIGASGMATLAALCIGPLKMSVREVINALQVFGLSVFYEHHGQSNQTIFDSIELKEALRNLIEAAGCSPDTMIGAIDPKSHSKCVFFVSPVVDITICHRLRTYRGRKGMLQCTILEVALASISTPGLFNYAEIGTNRRKYTSAGVHDTNPIRDVLDEAEQVFGKEQRVACLLSLGGGTASGLVMPSNLAHLEVHGLLQAMYMQQRLVTEEVSRRFGGLEVYYRFSVKGIGSGSLRDWTHWSAEKVEDHIRRYLDDPKQSQKLVAAAEQLWQRRGTATLNTLNHASDTTVVVRKVPPLTPFFVLRKKAWAFIEKNLANAPMDNQLIFLLTGLGGCGKSTLFSYYVQVYGYKYSYIFTIDAGSVHSIKADLQSAIRSLGPEHSQKTWEEALRYFELDGLNKNWLIGIESADDPSLPLYQFIPKSDHGTIFITSRNRDLFSLTTRELQWELGPMTAEEALDTLLSSAQRADSPSNADREDGASLVERLGELPLAIVQAGVYCFQKSGVGGKTEEVFSFRQYLEEMDQDHGDLMKYSSSESLDGYGKSVYQSLNMSYSALPQLTRDFLHLCGYFHHTNIPIWMLESAVDARFRLSTGIVGVHDEKPVVEKRLTDLLQSSGKSTTIHLHKIIFSLKMFSLVVTSMTPNSIMLNYHALVSAWSRDILSPKQQQLYSAMATRVVSTCAANDKYYAVHTLLPPHIREIIKRSEDLHLNDTAAFASRLLLGGMAAEAEALYRQMYEACGKKYGKSDEKSLMLLNNLAYSIKNQGRHKEAMKLEQEVLDGKRNIYSENDDRILMTESNSVASYIEQERWDEAEVILSRVLAARKTQLGSQDPRTLKTMHNIAIVYSGQKRHEEAMKLREEVLEVRRRVLGRDHPDTLSSMTHLAVSYIRSDRLDDGQKLEEEALELGKVTNGKHHPSTLLAMNNLADTYGMQGKFGDALTLGDEALDGRKRVLGNKHPDTLQTMYVVAKICFQMDRISEGIKLQEELRELEGVEGKRSNDLLSFLRSLYLVM